MEPAFIELSPLPAVRAARDAFILTRKFVSGMERFAELWPGPVLAVLHPAEKPTAELDPVEVRPERLRFGLKILRYDSPELRSYLAVGGAVVHWGAHPLLDDLGDVLAAARVPNVYIAEYSLRTRQDIIDASKPGLLLRWRRRLWASGQERRIRRDVARAVGFEANGTPAFDAYGGLNPRRLLFFDSRTTSDLLVAPEDLERRLAEAADPRRPLRLVFSGRLHEMKGPLDLIDVALGLRIRGVPFRMSIFGGGPLEPRMRGRIAKEGLDGYVTLRGVLPFADGLMPLLRREADVFVCCHRQGDPACTYLETFACGVPIAGYRNEALDGLLKQTEAGWSVPVGNPSSLAALLEGLHRNRSALAATSRAALAFASAHTFERTFEKRVAFIREAAGRA